MSAYLQVKAILLKEGVEEGMKEIRRFRMDEERGGGMGGRQRLQSLLTHVHSVFNVNTATQRCTLYWKDEDGDLIQFSTEEELSHALETMHDGTFRLYVTLSEDQAEASEEEQMTERRVTFDVTPELYCTDPTSVARLPCAGRGGHRGSHRGRKDERATCRAKDAEKSKEFKEVREQVPAEFRRWVRQYVRTWYTQGPEATQNSAKKEQLPEGVGHDFPQWLDTFLHCHPLPHPSGDGKMEVEDLEGMKGEGPEGMPPVYFRWLTLFLPRFHACLSRRRAASADSESEEKRGASSDGHRRKCHKGHGKHGCHGKKGGKHGAYYTSSESEESDGGQKARKQVPKEFRKYARVTVKQLHKNKGNNSDNKEKATQAGVPAEVQEFVEQILLEWHAKLSSKRPRAVAMEMMAGERTLPAGMEQEHFLWLCRFLARWHRRHAGKCDVMSGWSSGETTSDETSGEETAPMEHMQEASEQMTERRVTFDVTPELYCTDPTSVARFPCAGRGGHRGSQRGRKGERATCRAKDAEKSKEFKEVREQVPAEFRRWVRQYVRTWYTQGPEAAQNSAKGEKLPEGVGHDFPQWLDTFLHCHPLPHPSGDGEMEVGDLEGMKGEGPEGMPPVYFRWLTLFLPRFHACLSRRQAASADSESEEKRGTSSDGHRRKCHKGHGKHGCHGKKGGKHGAYYTSSESEESDGGQKARKQVPKEFRKYARVTVKQLHKNKGNNSDNKEKATQAGVPAEVQEFVEQILLEWHAKLSSKRPHAVAMEMMAGERTLPAGMEQEHFLWLCRFLARWHRQHAGKCDVMSGWSSGETTSDETSGEETTPMEHMQDYGPWPHNRREFRAIMKMVGRHPRGMMGHPHFAMYRGMGHPFFAPPHARGCGPRCGAKRFNRMGGCGPHECCKRWKEQPGAGQGEARGAQDESVRHVTEGMKKM